MSILAVGLDPRPLTLKFKVMLLIIFIFYLTLIPFWGWEWDATDNNKLYLSSNPNMVSVKSFVG